MLIFIYKAFHDLAQLQYTLGKECFLQMESAWIIEIDREKYLESHSYE